MFGRRVGEAAQRQALAIALIGVGVVAVSTLVLLSQGDWGLGAVLFEVTGAFGTAGLSTGITAAIPATGQILLVLLMFAGWVGPLTVGAALAVRARDARFRCPEERPSLAERSWLHRRGRTGSQAVVVIGLGRFGTASAETLAGLGHDVLGVDESPSRVAALRDEPSHVVEPTAPTRSPWPRWARPTSTRPSSPYATPDTLLHQGEVVVVAGETSSARTFAALE